MVEELGQARSLKGMELGSCDHHIPSSIQQGVNGEIIFRFWDLVILLNWTKSKDNLFLHRIKWVRTLQYDSAFCKDSEENLPEIK